ncbi:MAG: hypothetical protein KC454_08930 [Flavobacteriales bacterium]|nr:hypothetical protein [Flavobacteriales bacterium]
MNSSDGSNLGNVSQIDGQSEQINAINRNVTAAEQTFVKVEEPEGARDAKRMERTAKQERGLEELEGEQTFAEWGATRQAEWTFAERGALEEEGERTFVNMEPTKAGKGRSQDREQMGQLMNDVISKLNDFSQILKQNNEHHPQNSKRLIQQNNVLMQRITELQTADKQSRMNLEDYETVNRLLTAIYQNAVDDIKSCKKNASSFMNNKERIQSFINYRDGIINEIPKYTDVLNNNIVQAQINYNDKNIHNAPSKQKKQQRAKWDDLQKKYKDNIPVEHVKPTLILTGLNNMVALNKQYQEANQYMKSQLDNDPQFQQWRDKKSKGENPQYTALTDAQRLMNNVNAQRKQNEETFKTLTAEIQRYTGAAAIYEIFLQKAEDFNKTTNEQFVDTPLKDIRTKFPKSFTNETIQQFLTYMCKDDDTLNECIDLVAPLLKTYAEERIPQATSKRDAMLEDGVMYKVEMLPNRENSYNQKLYFHQKFLDNEGTSTIVIKGNVDPFSFRPGLGVKIDELTESDELNPKYAQEIGSISFNEEGNYTITPKDSPVKLTADVALTNSQMQAIINSNAVANNQLDVDYGMPGNDKTTQAVYGNAAAITVAKPDRQKEIQAKYKQATGNDMIVGSDAIVDGNLDADKLIAIQAEEGFREFIDESRGESLTLANNLKKHETIIKGLGFADDQHNICNVADQFASRVQAVAKHHKDQMGYQTWNDYKNDVRKTNSAYAQLETAKQATLGKINEKQDLNIAAANVDINVDAATVNNVLDKDSAVYHERNSNVTLPRFPKAIKDILQDPDKVAQLMDVINDDNVFGSFAPTLKNNKGQEEKVDKIKVQTLLQQLHRDRAHKQQATLFNPHTLHHLASPEGKALCHLLDTMAHCDAIIPEGENKEASQLIKDNILKKKSTLRHLGEKNPLLDKTLWNVDKAKKITALKTNASKQDEPYQNIEWNNGKFQLKEDFQIDDDDDDDQQEKIQEQLDALTQEVKRNALQEFGGEMQYRLTELNSPTQGGKIMRIPLIANFDYAIGEIALQRQTFTDKNNELNKVKEDIRGDVDMLSDLVNDGKFTAAKNALLDENGSNKIEGNLQQDRISASLQGKLDKNIGDGAIFGVEFIDLLYKEIEKAKEEQDGQQDASQVIESIVKNGVVIDDFDSLMQDADKKAQFKTIVKYLHKNKLLHHLKLSSVKGQKFIEEIQESIGKEVQKLINEDIDPDIDEEVDQGMKINSHGDVIQDVLAGGQNISLTEKNKYTTKKGSSAPLPIDLGKGLKPDTFSSNNKYNIRGNNILFTKSDAQQIEDEDTQRKILNLLNNNLDDSALFEGLKKINYTAARAVNNVDLALPLSNDLCNKIVNNATRVRKILNEMKEGKMKEGEHLLLQLLNHQEPNPFTTTLYYNKDEMRNKDMATYYATQGDAQDGKQVYTTLTQVLNDPTCAEKSHLKARDALKNLIDRGPIHSYDAQQGSYNRTMTQYMQFLIETLATKNARGAEHTHNIKDFSKMKNRDRDYQAIKTALKTNPFTDILSEDDKENLRLINVAIHRRKTQDVKRLVEEQVLKIKKRLKDNKQITNVIRASSEDGDSFKDKLTDKIKTLSSCSNNIERQIIEKKIYKDLYGHLKNNKKPSENSPVFKKFMEEINKAAVCLGAEKIHKQMDNKLKHKPILLYKGPKDNNKAREKWYTLPKKSQYILNQMATYEPSKKLIGMLKRIPIKHSDGKTVTHDEIITALQGGCDAKNFLRIFPITDKTDKRNVELAFQEYDAAVAKAIESYVGKQKKIITTQEIPKPIEHIEHSTAKNYVSQLQTQGANPMVITNKRPKQPSAHITKYVLKSKHLHSLNDAYRNNTMQSLNLIQQKDNMFNTQFKIINHLQTRRPFEMQPRMQPGNLSRMHPIMQTDEPEDEFDDHEMQTDERGYRSDEFEMPISQLAKKPVNRSDSLVHQPEISEDEPGYRSDLSEMIKDQRGYRSDLSEMIKDQRGYRSARFTEDEDLFGILEDQPVNRSARFARQPRKKSGKMFKNTFKKSFKEDESVVKESEVLGNPFGDLSVSQIEEDGNPSERLSEGFAESRGSENQTRRMSAISERSEKTSSFGYSRSSEGFFGRQ